MGGAVAVLGALGVPVALELQADTTSDCLYVLGSDHSNSQRDGLVEEHIANAHAVLDEAAACGATLIVKAFRWPIDASDVWSGSLVGEGDSEFARARDAEEKLDKARDAVRRVFSLPPHGLSNHLGFIESVETDLSQLEGIRQVHVWDFGDGINTTPELEMRRADLSPSGITSILPELEVPDCENWTLNFIGTNKARKGSREDDFADEVREFWRAYVGQCGGTIGRYGSELLDGG